MRTKNPDLAKSILEYVNRFYRDGHDSPTVRQVAQGVGVSRATAQRYLAELGRDGRIKYERGVCVDPEAVKCTSEYFSAPLLGSIRCGPPESESAEIEEYVSLPRSIFGAGDCYILRAKGDSMTDAGIDEGDLVVIHIQHDAKVGDIVVALDAQGQNTLKRYAGIDEKNGLCILEYMNEKNYPGQVELVRELVVQGVAKQIIKEI